jgi:hypothetical protein
MINIEFRTRRCAALGRVFNLFYEEKTFYQTDGGAWCGGAFGSKDFG